MAHTLYEQVYTMTNTAFNSEECIAELKDFFVNVLGWTASEKKSRTDGQYYIVYSNVDPSMSLNVGRNTYAVRGDMQDNYDNSYFLGMVTLNKIYYHISENEKTCYLRLSGESNTVTLDLLIAYDDNNKGTLFYTRHVKSRSGDPTISTTGEIITHSHIAGKTMSLKNTGAVFTIADNIIYRTPNIRNHSLCSELYSVISVQAFADITNTYISINGKTYRIVKCVTTNSTVNTPTFAFPVSDE